MADPHSVPDPATVIASIWAMLSTIAAGFERYRSTKKSNKSEIDAQSVSDSKMWQARGDTLAKMAEEYKEYFEKERAEHAKTRDYWHDKATTFQSDMAKCQEQIIRLESRPDLTELMQGIERILAIIEKDYRESHKQN
jgi:hypothetical protein